MKSKVYVIFSSSIALILYVSACTGNHGGGQEFSDSSSTQAVEAAISKKTSDPNVHKALLQDASVFQSIADGNTQYQQLGDQQDKALSCLWALIKVNDPLFDDKFLEDIIFNTHEKRVRYIKFNASFSGTVFTAAKETIKNCGFKVNQ